MPATAQSESTHIHIFFLFKIIIDNYPLNHVKYAWKEGRKGSVGVRVFDKELSHFYITDVKTSSSEAEYSVGKYSILKAHFTFKRRLGYFVMQVYTPCVFLVTLAGFSFWVDPRATPARVALSLTTLLTTATIWASVNTRMPKVSYVKAIDIFFLVSFGFVFFTLLQYILLLTLKHHTHLRKIRKVSLHENICSRKEVSNAYKSINSRFPANTEHSSQAQHRLQRRYCSVFSEDFDTMEQDESRDRRSSEITLDPETLYYYKQKKEFKNILWLDKFSRVFYLFCYFLFLVLYWQVFS